MNSAGATPNRNIFGKENWRQKTQKQFCFDRYGFSPTPTPTPKASFILSTQAPTIQKNLQCSVSKLELYLSHCSGRSTAVEHTPRNREVVGSNPAGCWAFSLIYPLSSASLIQVPQRGGTLLIFLHEICLAVQFDANKHNKGRVPGVQLMLADDSTKSDNQNLTWH